MFPLMSGPMRAAALVSLLILTGLQLPMRGEELEPPQTPAPTGLKFPGGPALQDLSPKESASIEGLPDIGYWMLDPKGTIADWLGIRSGGKRVAEPINLIILDEVSGSFEAAVGRLEGALVRAGFPGRRGHSGGYSAMIGGIDCPEILSHSRGTFSDASFLSENDHGRIFGPLRTDEGFVFTAAFSRERPDSFRMRHVLVSFNVARLNVAQALESSGLYRVEGFVPLGNALFWSKTRTTWDHDGNAVLVEAVGEAPSPGEAVVSGEAVAPAQTVAPSEAVAPSDTGVTASAATPGDSTASGRTMAGQMTAPSGTATKADTSSAPAGKAGE